MIPEEASNMRFIEPTFGSRLPDGSVPYLHTALHQDTGRVVTDGTTCLDHSSCSAMSWTATACKSE
jgi:hypothetical protein